MPPPRRLLHRPWRYAGLLFICLILFELLGTWPAAFVHAATPLPTPAKTHNTVSTFLQQGASANGHGTKTPFVKPKAIPAVPLPTSAKTASAHPKPSYEPPTMTNQAYALDSSFLVNHATAPATPSTSRAAKVALALTPAAIPAGSGPLTFQSSDGRLSLQLARGSIDLTHATIDGNTAPVGSLSLQISQQEGHSSGESSILGIYQVVVVDSQGHQVHGLQLRTPLTVTYHYNLQELTALDLDGQKMWLSWPQMLAPVEQSHGSTAPYLQHLSDNLAVHTLSAQVSTLGMGTMVISGTPELQAPPKPHLASENSNSGGLTYSYPLDVAPGVHGFAPQLALTYSSESTNERYSRRSPADAPGDGWSLDLGSISVQQYPASSTSGAGTWYFISGVGNVSDRLIQSSTGSNAVYYATEHMSYLRIKHDTQNDCFDVWARDGEFYEFGCTPDSKQYTLTNGTKSVYRYDLDEILAPYESTGSVNTILISYLQYQYPSGGTIQDAVLKQIQYGIAPSTHTTAFTLLAGTVDFSYLAPFDQGNFAHAYTDNSGSYYNTCVNAPPPDAGTNFSPGNLRCDDPVNDANSDSKINAPDVMSVFSLSSVSSYVGDDSSSTHLAYSYAMSYQDTSFVGGDHNSNPDNNYYDPYTLVPEYAAGEHLLESVVPTIYQNGTAHARQGLQLGYTGPLSDSYSDPAQKTSGGQQQFGGQTFWRYLDQYRDLDTGQGENITYQTAMGNTNGTPVVTDGNGNVTDDRLDPFYCTLQANNPNTSLRCTGNYGNAQDFSWSFQAVTQIQALGKDSSSGSLSLATTTYHYDLAQIVTPPAGTNCHPITLSGYPQESSCTGDNWVPGYNGVKNQQDGDWQDYYHAEFRGFATVYTTSAAGNLTIDHYFSTEGWNTPQSNGGNYNSGQVYEADVFAGNTPSQQALLTQTLNFYAGVGSQNGNPYGNINTCNGNLNPTYNPCLADPLTTITVDYDGSGSNSNAPYTKTDNTYDDISTSSGYVGTSSTYHHLLKQVISSNNAPTLTKQWQYQVYDGTDANGVTSYNVDLVKHSEIDDSSGHVWKCEDTSYDEGNTSVIPVHTAGYPTTSTSYSNCANQSGTALKIETGYDQYGNASVSVDPFGVANASLYSSAGCTPATANKPVALPTSWTAGKYTTCTTFDTTAESQPAQNTNVLNQSTSISYDATQGELPTSTTDQNALTTSLSYSYPNAQTQTVQQKRPGETGSYTEQSSSHATCTMSSSLPCYEIDTNSSQYSSAVTQTFYDSEGREVETRTPLDSGDDLISYTVHNDAANTSFTSLPFRYPHGSGFVDPATATIDNNGSTQPGGTTTVYDALGRVIHVADPAEGSSAEPGVTCDNSSGTWTSCLEYQDLNPHLDSGNEYSAIEKIDANNHITVTYVDALGRTHYTQYYKQRGAVNSQPADSNVTAITETDYNALNLPTKVIQTDLTPQSNQSTTSVTATTSYDDMGRVTSETDPDRWTDTYSYDQDGRVLTDVETSGSSTKTIGTSYDLLGRARCVQDAAPTTNGSGACSNGSHPLMQDTYDTTTLGTAGSTDFPVGELTKSVASTYYPDGSASTSTEQFQHDNRGQLTEETMQLGVPSSWNVTTALPTYQLSESYNDADQPMTTQTTVGGQAGSTFSQAYDSTTGELTGLSNNGTGVANLAKLAYNTLGLTSGITFQTPSGTAIASEAYSYDANERPTLSSASWLTGSGSSGSIFSAARVYDPAGNVTTTTLNYAAVAGQSNSGGGETEDYCYDEQNRLVWAGNTGSIPSAGNGTCGSTTPANTLSGAGFNSSYQYTHLGQLWQGPLNGTGGAQQYLYCDSTHPHQLTGLYPLGTTCSNKGSATPSYTASYDPWGNQTGRSYNSVTATLSYDIQNHLVEWNAGSTNQSFYAYDSTGERTLQRSITANGTSITVYAFGIEEHVYGGSGTPTSSTYYYSLGGHLIGSTNGSSTQFYLTDALGSLLESFSDIAGTASVLGNQAFGPYGNTQYQSGTLGTAKGFTGQYQDPSGLDYDTARYYDPIVGLFISADSVQSNQEGMNPYAYVGGNPETDTDPTGTFVSSPDGRGYYPAIPKTSFHGSYITYNNGWVLSGYDPLPPPPPTTTKPHSSGPLGFISGVVNTVTHVVTDAVHHPLKTVLHLADTFLGISSMAHDFQVLQSGASWQDKLMALGDLGFNAVSDAMLLTGVGDLADIGIKIGADLLEHGGIEAVSHIAEEEGEHVAEDELEHAAEGCGGLSFSYNTLVTTSVGAKAIGTLKVGQKVWSYNPKTKKMEWEPIQHVWIDHDNDLVDLTIGWTKHTKKGDVHEDETIHTNQKHPFLTVEAGFVPVSNLNVGMHLVEGNGQVAIIEDWLVIAGSQTMYNLTVQQDHTYTVGDGQFVVHNCGGGYKNGISADEIRSINRSFGGEVEQNSTAETTLANAQNYNGFWNKAAVQVRDIAGGHMFNNGNKRTAQAVVETLMERNNIVTGVSSQEMRGVVFQVAKGELRDIPSIASALRGW